MRARRGVVTVLVALTVLPGCEYGRRFINKPWGKGTYIPAVVCTAVGAGIGVLIQNERAGTSTVTVGNQRTSVSDDKDLWQGAAVGAPIGAVVCGLLGHAIFDPEAATPSPSPPTAPLPTPPLPVPSPSAPPLTSQPLPPPSSRRVVLRGVNFDFDKSDIRHDSRPILNEAAKILQENPNVRIAVEGHTDAIGSDAYNEQLSLRRADAVFRYLVNHGIAPERMQVTGYGKRRPVASNETENGRAQNRRVELHVVAEPQAPE
jgi:outer membrane protein OmpA-like peptidoglycan-associated protein